MPLQVLILAYNGGLTVLSTRSVIRTVAVQLSAAWIGACKSATPRIPSQARMARPIQAGEEWRFMSIRSVMWSRIKRPRGLLVVDRPTDRKRRLFVADFGSGQRSVDAARLVRVVRAGRVLLHRKCPLPNVSRPWGPHHLGRLCKSAISKCQILWYSAGSSEKSTASGG